MGFWNLAHQLHYSTAAFFGATCISGSDEETRTIPQGAPTATDMTINAAEPATDMGAPTKSVQSLNPSP